MLLKLSSDHAILHTYYILLPSLEDDSEDISTSTVVITNNEAVTRTSNDVITNNIIVTPTSTILITDNEAVTPTSTDNETVTSTSTITIIADEATPANPIGGKPKGAHIHVYICSYAYT